MTVGSSTTGKFKSGTIKKKKWNTINKNVPYIIVLNREKKAYNKKSNFILNHLAHLF